MRDAHQFSCHLIKLLQEFAFIKELNPHVQSKIGEIVTHTSRNEGDVLFCQDELPDCCYIVLVGEVWVWQRKRAHMDTPEVPALKEGNPSVRRHAEVILSMVNEDLVEAQITGKPKRLSVFTEKAFTRTGSANRKKTEKVGLARRKSLSGHEEGEAANTDEWAHVATLGSGMMLGEVGLLEDQPRNASVKCNADTELLVIKKIDFDRVLKMAMNRLRFQKLAGPMRQFLKEFDFFKKLDNDVQMQLPEILRYVHYKEGALVFLEGDKPENMFVILTGEVRCHVKAAEGGGSISAPRAGRALRMKTAAVLERLHEHEAYRHTSCWVEDDVDIPLLGPQVAVFGPGQTFGEQALMEDRPRNASMTCRTDCEFLCVSKDDFTTLLARKMQEANLALPSLITPLIPKIPFFQALGKRTQDAIGYTMSCMSAVQGKVLYWEGDAADNLYFILGGQVAVWWKAADHDFYSKKPEIETGSKDLVADCDEVMDVILDRENAACVSVYPVVLHAMAMRKQQELQTQAEEKVCAVLGSQERIFGQGCLFGEAYGETCRPRSMTCLEPCRLLVLSRIDYDRVVKEEMLRVKVRQLATAVRRLLKEFDLFKDLEAPVQENLSEIVRYFPVQAGKVIFEQGDAPDLCYIILSGEVTVWTAKVVESRHHVHDLTLVAGEEKIEEYKKDGEYFVRPPLTFAGLLAREKSTGLGNMLSAAAKEVEANMPDAARGRSKDRNKRLSLKSTALPLFASLEDVILQATNNAVATLGPGTIFGELALMNDDPRNATVSCYNNCEFLVMEKKHFDAILKAHIVMARDNKFKFLRDIVPGVRNLSSEAIDKLLYHFAKESVPRNHFFLEQGEIMDGSIYFIWQGSVESYHRDPETGGLVRCGIMLEGSILAAVPQSTRAPISIVATSSPCQVLHVKPENRKHFPDCVIRSLREVLDNTISRRSAQCLPLSPMGSVFSTQSPGSLLRPGSKAEQEQRKKQFPHSRTGKVPRPLSGKIPPILQSSRPGGHLPRASPFSKLGGHKVLGQVASLPSFNGLFRREVTEVDYEAFELDPGETIAIRARKPRRRERKHLTESTSLPALK